MKPQEFEKIVRAKTPVVESAPESIVEATPAPVLKSMDITSINQQYHALLGESSLRGFAPGENGGGTEAYTMEDEELDGMALGELQAIAQAAKKIFASVKQGVPLEAWMYKKITNGNEGLTAVAQQINNPAVREQPGVAEGLEDTQKKIEDTINKLEDRLKHAKSDEQWGRISARIERLQAGLKRSKQGVAEGLSQTLRKVVPGYAKREIDKKMDAGKFGKTDVDKDANYYRYKKIQDKLKEQGVAEGLTTRGGFGGSASQAYHEIEWLKKKIASLPPTKEKQIRDLQRQIRERELAIAFQKEGVAEGSLNEFAIDKEPNGDNRSKLIGTIVQLLKSGKKVDFYVPGIRGHVVGSGGNGDWLTLKRWNKPYSKINYSLELDASDDSRFSLKMIKPDYYQVVQSEDMNQGVAEGSISDLLNKDPKSPKFNDHSAPRKTKHSGSTPTPYEQGRLDAHRKKSYNNIHNSEQDAEDYKTGYRHVKSRQGVAEGSGGNWYIRVNGKILNDTKFKPMIFSSEDEARSYAMKLADKKRIPLSQIKLTKSWMDAPEQGVAEGSGKNVVKSIKVGNFRHDLVDTGMGWQVRIYNGDELYDTGLSKNSEQKGLAALEDAVAYTEKQTRTKRQGVAEGIFDRFKKKQPAKPQRMPITDEQRAAIIQHFPTNHNANLKWGRKENDDYVLPDNVTVQFGKGIINFINYDGNLIASVAYYRSKEDRMNPKAIPLTHFDKPINSDKDLEQLKSNLVEGSLNEFAPAGFDGFEGDDRVPMHFIVEKDSYNPRSKWKKSYKPQGGGIALFTTKQEAIQAAEKFNKLDPNREFKYGGTQLVHVEDDDKQLDEFAPGNGDDDDFDPETANMAHQEGVVKGFSLVDGATVEQALQIPHCQWGKLYNGQYKQYFVKGFIDGRKAKLEQARKDGVELSLQKDGSLSRVQQGVAEGWIDDDAAEPLAKYFADLYYGDFSVTMKIKLAAHIYQSIQNGELTIEQLKAEIDMLEKEKGIKEQGVAEGNVEKTTTGLKHTRDYEYPTKGREFNKDLDRLNKTQTGILDKALGVEWTPTNKRKEITGDQTGVAENFEPGETKRVLKSGGKPAGEIGLDPEASPGNGAYYIKHYASGKDLGGYDTYQEALEELRYIDKQYQHANRPADTRSKHQKMMDNPAYAEGYRDGKRGVTGKNVADIFGPMSDVYHQGYKAGKQGVTEGLTEIKKGQKDSNGYTKCWPGKHAEGTKKGKNGGQVRNCVPNESVEQDPNDPQWSKKYNKDVGESTTKIPTGLKHHGDYGSKYPPEEYRDEYGHRVRGQKYVPGHEENEYDHKGRPPKAPLAKVELPADAFGRVSGKVPKGKQGIRISGKSNTDESTDYASAVNNLLNEFAGGMGVSSVAVGPGAMKNPAKTGSLFGGSYTQKNSPFKKKATKKESVIKR